MIIKTEYDFSWDRESVKINKNQKWLNKYRDQIFLNDGRLVDYSFYIDDNRHRIQPEWPRNKWEDDD